MQPRTQSYQPIKPRVERYDPIDEEDEPPMASEAGSEMSSVVRIRRTAPTSNLQMETEIDDFEDDFEDDFDDEMDEDDDLEGFGGYTDEYGVFVTGTALTAVAVAPYVAGAAGAAIGIRRSTAVTAARLRRLKTRRYKLRQKLKTRTRKTGPWSRKSLRRRIRKISKKIRVLERKARQQMRSRRKDGKQLTRRQRKLRRAGVRPRRKASAATATGRSKLKSKLARKMMRKGWKRPPASFMPRSRALLRWKIWNRSKLARRRHWARFRRSRRGRSMFPGYRPIPRPVPRYRTLTPRVQSYRQSSNAWAKVCSRSGHWWRPMLQLQCHGCQGTVRSGDQGTPTPRRNVNRQLELHMQTRRTR